MKHCYLLQTHRDPELIVRLARRVRLGSPGAHIVVCHDLSGVRLELGLFAGLEPIDLIYTLEPLKRGEYSLAAAYLDAVDWMLARSIGFDWLTYLSGQDYPVAPLADYEHRLATGGFDGYLRFGDVLSPQGPWGKSRRGHRRYFYRYRRFDERWREPIRLLRSLNNFQTLLHVQLTYAPHVGWRCLSTPFDGDTRCYAGLQWHSLNRACVEYVAATSARDPDLLEHFKHTICADEALVATVLANARQFRLCNDCLRYIDHRSSRDGSPRILTTADFTELTSGPYCFARKFDPAVDSQILDLLDRHLDLRPEKRRSA